MEKCGNCSANVIAGQGCISCGHLNGAEAAKPPEAPQSEPAEVAESPFADLMGTSEKPGLGGKLKSAKAAPFLAGLGALLVLGIGFMALFGGKADQADVVPDEFANPPAAQAPETGATVGVQFCGAPGPVADAPEPDPTSTNVIASFYKFGTTDWKVLDSGAYSAEYINSNADSTDLSPVPDSADPAYIACVTGIANNTDRTCRIYEGSARHIISGADYSLAVYQLSTGEMVVEGPVRNAPTTCPPVVVGQVSYSEYLPRQHDLAMWTADLAVPNQFTNVHLDRAALGGSAEWCQSPAPIDTGIAPTSSGVKLMLAENIALRAADVAWTSEKMSEISHIACIRFAEVTTDEGDHSCDYQGGNKLVRPRGLFEVSLVDIVTGEATTSNIFDSAGGCTSIVIFNRDGQTRHEDAQPEPSLYEWLNEQNPTPAVEDGLTE